LVRVAVNVVCVLYGVRVLEIALGY
jgi:hypothetical protein